MTTAIDELKTVIILAGIKRLTHLEEEIFANEELTTLYLHSLCKEETWYDINHVHAMSNSFLVAHYSVYVIEDFWPSAEVILNKYPNWVTWYEHCLTE